MGNTKSKPQINDECPICYTKQKNKSDGIVLNCGHYFSNYCIQKHCLKTVLEKIPSNCPLCNQYINKSYIKKIYKKIHFLTADPMEWYRRDIHHLGDGHYFMGMNFSVKKFSEDIIVLAPLFKNIDYKLPAYMYTPLLRNVKKTRHIIFNNNHSQLSDNLEFIPKLEHCIEGTMLFKSKDWKNFLIYITHYLQKQKYINDLSNIVKDKYFADCKFFKYQKIRLFFTNNYDNINYVDKVNYNISKGYNYFGTGFAYPHIFQFQPLIYVIKGKAYLINKITGLMKESLLI